MMNVKLTSVPPTLSIPGEQGDQWIRLWVQLTVNLGHHYSIVFQARRGLGERGDIALDDFTVTDGNCTVRPIGRGTLKGKDLK